MTITKMTVVFALVLALAGAAQATHLVNLEGTADCDGWQVSGLVHFGSTNLAVVVDYNIDLLQDGVVVIAASGSVPVATDAPWSNVSFTVTGTWDDDLCGIYAVAGSATLTIDDVTEGLTFTAPDLDCDCPPEDDGCFRTPGYWKNHDWPVESLMVAGVETSRDDLMAILWSSVNGDATVILAKHLIAAKLNVISGADDGIQGVIDDADAFLIDHPVFSRPGGSTKQSGLALKDDLADYNEQGCGDDDNSDDADKSAAIENSTWSDLKDLYR